MSSPSVVSMKSSSVVPQKVTAPPSKPVSPTPSGHQSSSGTSAPQNHSKHNRRRNRHSHGKNGKPTGKPSNPQQQNQQGKKGNFKGGHQSRPKLQTPKIRRGPVFEYVSVCCGVRALKPRAATKIQVSDPETKKPKTEVKGLGHWRCPNCKKACKVVRRKPEPKPETVPVLSTVVPTEGTDVQNS